jgi:23S rRNA (uracil1939-C5)-methyltransferase
MSFIIEPTDFSYGGEAIGRIDGKVVFVAGALPGERIVVETIEEKKQFIRSRLIEVIDPSIHRVASAYPELLQCGCSWQYIKYSAQLHWKTHIVYDILCTIGKQTDPVVHPCIGMSTEQDAHATWGYRNHARFVCNSNKDIGIYRENSHIIQDLATYPLLYPELDLTYQQIRAMLVSENELAQVVASFSIRGTGETQNVSSYNQLVSLHLHNQATPEDAKMLMHIASHTLSSNTVIVITQQGREILAVPQNFFMKQMRNFRFRISEGSFFQVNDRQTLRLIDCVQQYLQPEKTENIIDAYSGVGLFSTFLADHYQHVSAIESAHSSIEDARFNAKENRQIHVHIYHGNVASVLPTIKGTVDSIVLDPPRAGCHLKVLQALIKKKPDKICYVSCNPATLARDIHILCESKEYNLMQVQPIDMFPHTYHIECVALLERAHQ